MMKCWIIVKRQSNNPTKEIVGGILWSESTAKSEACQLARNSPGYHIDVYGLVGTFEMPPPLAPLWKEPSDK